MPSARGGPTDAAGPSSPGRSARAAGRADHRVRDAVRRGRLSRRLFDPPERALNPAARKVQLGRELRQRGLGRRLAQRRDRPHRLRHAARRPSISSGFDRLELARGRGRDPLEVRRLRVEDAVEVAPHGPGDLPRLELEERGTRPDPAQERADLVGALPGHHAPPAADPDARRQPGRGEPSRPARAPPRGGRRTRGAVGHGPPRAIPGPGTGPAARPPDSGPPIRPR